MLIHVHWEMGWESETQDAQCLKTGKSLDKKLHGALSPPARERPGSTRAIWLKTCAGCTAFFHASKSVINPLLSLRINSLISNCKKPPEGDKCNVRGAELRRAQPPWNRSTSNCREL